ncbi:MAG: hypothetical protein M3220_17740 [Chloroflexota bacterium]|nr:hypothetical protein [Chloroflexota bacterium]
MGGSGSGNWYRWDKKTTVEACRHIDAARWQREGILRAEVHHPGAWGWTDAHTGEQTASLVYEVNTMDPSHAWVRLIYTFPQHGGPYDYTILLTTTRPHFGGLRWWFVCPLVIQGRPCRRRVQKLYLPPGEVYYGCRHCYSLTYTSSQDSHRDDRFWKFLARDTGWDWRTVRNVMDRKE